MFTSNTRTAWAGAGLLLALTVASPVWADDVELLLSNPAASNAAKPNILFILDSSGSMTTIEKSQEPYSSDTTYEGDCPDDMYYWTTGSTINQSRSPNGGAGEIDGSNSTGRRSAGSDESVPAETASESNRRAQG